MRLELTDLSEQTYRTIGAVGKDPLSAIDFLRSDIQIREFYPSLRQLYPESDIKERLVNVFSEISPDTERASVIRRVQNWNWHKSFRRKSCGNLKLVNIWRAHSVTVRSRPPGRILIN